MPIELPTNKEEKALFEAGYVAVCGVDEAGAGCWAGPVYAAAAIMPIDVDIPLIRDSKMLSEKQRESVIDEIKEVAVAWAVGTASAEEIDRINIRQAGALAMRRAIAGLPTEADFVLSDAFLIPGLSTAQKNIISGDKKVVCIAAASIIAKVERDRHMKVLDARHPGYQFSKHKGYGTKIHQEALAKLGICPEHRKTYAPVAKVIKEKMGEKQAI